MSLRVRIREFIKDTFLVDEIGDDESFLTSGVIDSLGILQLVAFVEGELGAKVPEPDLVPENFDSIARIAAYVERVQCRVA
jgi:acyl carrier protein